MSGHDGNSPAPVGQNKREFLKRNCLAIGAIAVSAIAARVDRASAGSCTSAAAALHKCCFLKGTTISTADGDRKVEELAIGQFVPTLFGGVRPIQWIGRFSYRKSNPRKRWWTAAMPVRVSRSALAPDVPRSDLFLTAGHSIYVDGTLFMIGDLLNGTTITRYAAEEFDKLEYYHIKLETHDVIDAQGALCETMLGFSEGADNFADYYRMYGSPNFDEQPCVPLLGCNGGRGQIRSRLRSAIAPWVDRRNALDLIRDRLDARGIALSLEAADMA